MKSVVVDTSAYDWEGDRPLGRSWHETVIYEAHVRGFTADPSSGLAPDVRGTYAGFIEKIPYLADLGITAVELMPVFAFDRLAAPTGLVNYWGYQPVSFFAPHQAYASRPGLATAVDEFRDLVKALHRPGSRSSSMSSTTTPPKPARTDRRSASAASPTTTTTSSTRPAAPSMTAGPATRSTRTTRSSVG